MVRATFVKHLRKIGEIPVPEGHLARNKGNSCYFFAPEQREVLQAFLKDNIGEPTVRNKPYPDGTLSYMALSKHEPKWVERSVLLWPENEKERFLVVSIAKWCS